MIHWLIIIFGIIVLTLSISNPFFNLTFKKILNLNFFMLIFIRIIFFLMGLIIVFFGLYIESLN